MFSTRSRAPLAYYFIIRFDGGSNVTKDRAGCGTSCSYVNSEGIELVLWDHYEFQPGWTNNQAEATGLLRGCEYLEKHGIREACFYGDSEIIMKGVFGSHSIGKEELVAIEIRIQSLLKNIKVMDWAQVYRESNSYCDALADMAIEHGNTVSNNYANGMSAVQLEADAIASLGRISTARHEQLREAANAERGDDYPFDEEFILPCLYTEEFSATAPAPPDERLIDHRCAGLVGTAHHLHNVLERAGLVIPRADAASLGDGTGRGRSMATSDLYATIVGATQAWPDDPGRPQSDEDLAARVGEWLDRADPESKVGLGNGTRLKNWARHVTGGGMEKSQQRSYSAGECAHPGGHGPPPPHANHPDQRGGGEMQDAGFQLRTSRVNS